MERIMFVLLALKLGWVLRWVHEILFSRNRDLTGGPDDRM